MATDDAATSGDGLEKKLLAALDATGLDARFSHADLIAWIVQSHGWDAVSATLETILASTRNLRHAEILADVYFSAAMEKLPFDCNRVIARLLMCGVGGGSNAYNALFGTCCEVKEVGYESGYSPEHDPEIRAEMARLSAEER